MEKLLLPVIKSQTLLKPYSYQHSWLLPVHCFLCIYILSHRGLHGRKPIHCIPLTHGSHNSRQHTERVHTMHLSSRGTLLTAREHSPAVHRHMQLSIIISNV